MKVLHVVAIMMLVSVTFGQDITLTEAERAIFTQGGVVIEMKDDDTWTFKHSGVPDHETGPYRNNLNEATDQNHEFDIPRIANFLKTAGCVRLGQIGMAVNGVPFFNPYTALGRNAVDGPCEETFDNCSGHPQFTGAYHYHKLPNCVFTGAQNQLLGVALDGHPIYGPLDETGRNLTTADLDDCHGHWHQGRYKYRITYDFPYILGCYKGKTLFTIAPPNGRNRRYITSHEKVDYVSHVLNFASHPRSLTKRQITRECQATDSNWMRETCFAHCENPGDGSYHNCDLLTAESEQQGTGSTTMRTGSDTTSGFPVKPTTGDGVNVGGRPVCDMVMMILVAAASIAVM